MWKVLDPNYKYKAQRLMNALASDARGPGFDPHSGLENLRAPASGAGFDPHSR